MIDHRRDGSGMRIICDGCGRRFIPRGNYSIAHVVRRVARRQGWRDDNVGDYVLDYCPMCRLTHIKTVTVEAHA